MLDFAEKGRYSKDTLKNILSKFIIIKIEEQGLFFTVIGNMLKQGILSIRSRTRYLAYLALPFLNVMVKLDSCKFVKNSRYLSSYTTGYFIVVRKEK
jgi:hypothetical protein